MGVSPMFQKCMGETPMLLMSNMRRYVESPDNGSDAGVLGAEGERILDGGTRAVAEVLPASVLWDHRSGGERCTGMGFNSRGRWRAGGAESQSRQRSACDDGGGTA